MGPPSKKKTRRCIMVKFSIDDEKFGNDHGKGGNDAEKKDLNGDPIFDPCAEMMIHDYDDERTLDEEEALENNQDPQVELSDLQKEGDMPLEQLLAMYGYADGENSDSDQDGTASGEQEGADPLDDNVSECNQDPEPSQLGQLYTDLSTTQCEPGGGSRLLRSRPQSEEEEEEEDCDYTPEEWKKTIMVGSDYQAKIPVGLCKYDDALPYENDDRILWNPASLTEDETEKFLAKLHDSPNFLAKDDEQALYLLLQCGYNAEEALRRRRINSVTPEGMSIWSEEECRNFETGIRLHGKDFYTIQKTKVRTRSVGELVEFYYLWKKTERHDVLASKVRTLEKVKYNLHPGITDFMDRFLEEQEIGTSPNSHSEVKRVRGDELAIDSVLSTPKEKKLTESSSPNDKISQPANSPT